MQHYVHISAIDGGWNTYSHVMSWCEVRRMIRHARRDDPDCLIEVQRSPRRRAYKLQRTIARVARRAMRPTPGMPF